MSSSKIRSLSLLGAVALGDATGAVAAGVGVSDGTDGVAANVGDAVGETIVGAAVAVAPGAGVVIPKLGSAEGASDGALTETQPTNSDATDAPIRSALDNVAPPRM